MNFALLLLKLMHHSICLVNNQSNFQLAGVAFHSQEHMSEVMGLQYLEGLEIVNQTHMISDPSG